MISLVLAPRLAAGGTFVSTSWSWVGDFRLRLQGCLFRCPTQPDCCRRKEGGDEPKKYGFTFERRVFCFSRERHVRPHHDGALVCGDYPLPTSTNSNFNDRGELRGHQLARQAAADFGCTCRASARPRRQRLNELD
jgi:hypothetical protein